MLRRAASQLLRPAVSSLRCFASETETKIAEKISAGLRCSTVEVEDTSGGCGTFYRINVVSEEFSGKGIVKQHQMVNKLLGEEVAKWHGFSLTTKAPEAPAPQK